MSPAEKEHIISAFCFEVGKVNSKDVQQQVVDVFSHVDAGLAERVAKGIGVNPPPKDRESDETFTSPSQENTVKTAATRQVAVLTDHGFSDEKVKQVLDACKQAGVRADIISPALGTVKGENGTELEASATFLTADSVLYDAVFIPGGKQSTDSLKAQNQRLRQRSLQPLQSDRRLR